MKKEEKSLESIPSPYDAPIVTPEILNKIRKLTNANAVFVVISDEVVGHKCNPDTCKGHSMNINSFGFTENQIMAIAKVLANSGGYKLVPKEEHDF